MAIKTSSYQKALLNNLADPKEAKLYLNAVLEDYPEGFLKALRKVAQARSMARLAEDAGVKRETLYRSLSDSGNPTFETLTSVLHALDLKMTIGVKAARKRRPEGQGGESPKVPVVVGL